MSLSKLSKLLAGLIIFFSATQLGLHFWPLSSLVYGIRIDYLAPTIYFLDLLIIIYLFINKLKGLKTDLAKYILPVLLTNLVYSGNPLATLSWSVHLVLYLFLIESLKSHLRTPVNKTKNIFALQICLLGSLLFQLGISIAQSSLGHSIGGLLYYFGERSVAVGSPAVALATFMDQVVLRAYGTFSHPNILAGWAVISLLIIIFLQTKYQNHKLRPIIPISLAISTLLVLLTQSRSAAISLFGFVIPFYLLKNLKFRISYFMVLALVVFQFGVLSPDRSDLSSAQRLDLQKVSLSVIQAFPIFGTGANASVSTYPAVSPNFRLLQPDHNSFSLFFSWFGLLGVLAILSLLHPFDLRHSLFFVFPLIPLLVLDHYLLTSPQGLFIICLYLAIAVNYSHAQNNRE